MNDDDFDKMYARGQSERETKALYEKSKELNSQNGSTQDNPIAQIHLRDPFTGDIIRRAVYIDAEGPGSCMDIDTMKYFIDKSKRVITSPYTGKTYKLISGTIRVGIYANCILRMLTEEHQCSGVALVKLDQNVVLFEDGKSLYFGDEWTTREAVYVYYKFFGDDP